MSRLRKSIVIAIASAALPFVSYQPSANALAQKSGVSTSTTKELKITDVKLRKNVTQWSVQFQAAEGQRFSIYFSDGRSTSAPVRVKSSKRCLGDWCKIKKTIGMPEDMDAGVLFVHTDDTEDLIGLQIFDPFTWRALAAFYSSGAISGNWANLIYCESTDDWTEWNPTEYERSQIARFYKRQKFVARFAAVALATSATTQEWYGANRLSLVSTNVALRLGSTVARSAGKQVLGTWKDLLPTPQQISNFSNLVAISAVNTDEICRRRNE